MPKKPLSDQVLVVTGASSGLGRAIARLAGERGAKVVVTARNEEALDNCVAEIERSGSEARRWCAGSSSSLPEIESLNSRMPLPSDRPISGSRFGPKTSNTTSSRIRISQMPIPKGTGRE